MASLAGVGLIQYAECSRDGWIIMGPAWGWLRGERPFRDCWRRAEG